MKSVYFQLVGGAAGDMLLSSLIGLGCPLSYLKKEFKKLDISFGVKEKEMKGHHHVSKTKLLFKGDRFTYYKDIVRIIKKSRLDKDIKDNVLRVYSIVAGAEKKVHKEEEKNLHFYHLGEIDAILEICGFFIALKYLKIDRVYRSSFPLGKPAPATLEILKDKEVEVAGYNYETVTPTAAALLRDVEESFHKYKYKQYSIGWGECGKDDYLITYLVDEDLDYDRVLKIETNIDDSSPQVFESLFERLYEEGAKEVYIEGVVMKKTRPAFVLNVLCLPYDFSKIRDIIFKYTSTFGIRYQEYLRDKLKCEFVYKKTKFGKIRFRKSISNVKKEMPEYQDCLRAAKRCKIPFLEVYQQIVFEGVIPASQGISVSFPRKRESRRGCICKKK
jgi:uncharacterized protein (DUF111 family)